MLYLKFAFVLMLLVNLAGCSNSISKDLQDQKWEFTAQKVAGPKSTVTFNGKRATFIKNDECKIYSYKLKKKPDGTTQFIMGGKNGVSHRSQTKHFEIKKSAKNYRLKPTNKLAKHYYGEAKLVPIGDDNSE